MIVDYPRRASFEQERRIQRHRTESMIEFCVNAVSRLPEIEKSLATVSTGHAHEALLAAHEVGDALKLLAMYLGDVHESLI